MISGSRISVVDALLLRLREAVIAEPREAVMAELRAAVVAELRKVDLCGGSILSIMGSKLERCLRAKELCDERCTIGGGALSSSEM